MEKRIIITGYGVVAKEFCKLLLNHSESIKNMYGFHPKVTGIIGTKGMLYEAEGISLDKLMNYDVGTNALTQYAEEKNIFLVPPKWNGDVLVECTPTDIETGEPGLSYILNAIEAGMAIVSASKGALVHSFKRIKEAARKKGVSMKFSGATAAALPTMDIGGYSLAGATITRIEGILNGTTNFILTTMTDNNLSFDEALKVAQMKGIAERNPSLDVKGYDSACKILLLTNGLLETSFSLNDIQIEGIEHVTKEKINEAQEKNERIKLLASVILKNEHLSLEVRPRNIPPSNPLYYVNGSNKGIVFETEEMGTVCVTGGASHPRGAAAAVLKDVINLYRRDL